MILNYVRYNSALPGIPVSSLSLSLFFSVTTQIFDLYSCAACPGGCGGGGGGGEVSADISGPIGIVFIFL